MLGSRALELMQDQPYLGGYLSARLCPFHILSGLVYSLVNKLINVRKEGYPLLYWLLGQYFTEFTLNWPQGRFSLSVDFSVVMCVCMCGCVAATVFVSDR